MALVSRALMIATFLLSSTSMAGVLIDFNYGGASMAMSSPKSRNNTTYLIRPGVFLSPTQMQWLYVGGAIGMVNQSTKQTTTETYSATDYMFGFKLTPTKTNWLWFSAYVCPSSTAIFKSTGNPKETWTGTALVGSVSFFYPAAKGLLMGFSLDYYSASYSKVTSASTSSSVSQTVSGFYPSISLGYLF